MTNNAQAARNVLDLIVTSYVRDLVTLLALIGVMQPFGSTGFQLAAASVLACKRNGRQDAWLPHSQDGCAPLSAALRRFRPAVSASVLQDENIPAHVRSVEISGKIIAQRGPYFLSGNWWDEKSWGRAEWDVQLKNGELVRCHESEGTWKLDGIYD